MFSFYFIHLSTLIGLFFVCLLLYMYIFSKNFSILILLILFLSSFFPSQVAVLNFMITEQGLREQLLANTVARERPDLQEKKEQLIVESAKNRDALYTIESKILEVRCREYYGNLIEKNYR